MKLTRRTKSPKKLGQAFSKHNDNNLIIIIKIYKLKKINKDRLKKVKVIARKLFSSLKNMKIPNLEKHACQNMVAMVIASSVNNDMSYQIVSSKMLGKVEKFGGFCFNIKKVINGQSLCKSLSPIPIVDR